MFRSWIFIKSDAGIMYVLNMRFLERSWPIQGSGVDSAGDGGLFEVDACHDNAEAIEGRQL